jgi:hypothetical protein
MKMKNYIEPIVNLLYISNEDILTVSDPCKDDGFNDETNAAE